METTVDINSGQGDLIAGRYRIVRPLREGGMGAVYEAYDEKLRRRVALKSILSDSFGRIRQDLLQRFMVEAERLAALDHPNICAIYDVGETQGRPFIVMNYVEGRTMQEIVEADALPIPRALEMAKQIAKGLRAAHIKGIIHRDVKSSNIMVTGDDTVKILDFGIAKLEGDRGLHLTATGESIGTPAYMSPEQVKGVEPDKRTDIFSFGVLLYEMLTRQLPFRGETATTIRDAIVKDQPCSLPPTLVKSAPDLIDLFEKLLAKDREQRYASFDEVLKSLDAIREVKRPIQPPVEAARTKPEKRPFWKLVSSMKLLLSILLVGLTVLVWKTKPWETVLRMLTQENIPQSTGQQPAGDSNTARKNPNIQPEDSTERELPSLQSNNNSSNELVVQTEQKRTPTIPNETKRKPVFGAGTQGNSTNPSSEAAAQTEKEQTLKEIRREPGSTLGIQWVWVEGGTFGMGSNDGDDDEKPVHSVTVDGFYMSAMEATFDQYDAFCDGTGRYKPSDYIWERGSQPVINVSWNDAAAFAKWLSGQTGRKVRLPTEAEWEYAARSRGKDEEYAGTNTESQLREYAWYSETETHPVGNRRPNGLGLYDMSGNVWEWCSDWYSDVYYRVSPPLNPMGPPGGESRVIRGGSLDDDATDCRSSRRSKRDPEDGGLYYGIRLVQEL